MTSRKQISLSTLRGYIGLEQFAIFFSNLNKTWLSGSVLHTNFRNAVTFSTGQLFLKIIQMNEHLFVSTTTQKTTFQSVTIGTCLDTTKQKAHNGMFQLLYINMN